MRLGVDLGGTKIEIAALDDGGDILLRERVPTPTQGYETAIAVIRDLVRRCEDALQEECTVGIAAPGSFSTVSGRVKNANSTYLNDRPFRDDINEALRREVRVANDANCFALSEATDGAAAGADVVFGVILGTGVGGGIVSFGRLWVGPNAIAGEWGHNPLSRVDASPHPCWCGRANCIETYLSGPALAAAYRAVAGTALAPLAIMARFAAREPAAVEVVEAFFHDLARALASVVNVLDPDTIVLGGGLSNIDAIYTSVPALMKPFVFSDSMSTKLVRNRHGDSSGVRGAAWLWP